MVYEVVSDKDKNIGRDRSKMDVFLVVQGHKSRIQSCYEVVRYILDANRILAVHCSFHIKDARQVSQIVEAFPPKMRDIFHSTT